MSTNTYALAKRLERIRREILETHEDYLLLDDENPDHNLVDTSVALQGIANQLIYIIRKTSSVNLT